MPRPKKDRYQPEGEICLLTFLFIGLFRLARYSDGMRRPVSTGCDTLPGSTCFKHKKRRPAMKKISTVQAFGNEIFTEQKLTIGVDLGDRWSFYCVLDEAGKMILEQKVSTTPEAMKETFERIPRSLMALETGTHSPWVSRLLKELGHETSRYPLKGL